MPINYKEICTCHNGNCCAGVNPKKEFFNFLCEIARVLNKANPRAEALLHGSDFIKPYFSEQLWPLYLETIEKFYKVKAEIINNASGKIQAIRIRPATQSLMTP